MDSIYWSKTKENDKVRDGGVRDNFQISLWSSWLDECVISLRQGESLTERSFGEAMVNSVTDMWCGNFHQTAS